MLAHDYYRSHSAYTDPGIFGYLYDDLPDKVDELIVIANTLFFHANDSVFYEYKIPTERYQDLNLRYTHKILEKLSSKSGSLLQKRNHDEKVIGICRDLALFCCSVLREKGIPARLRTGYVDYLIPGLFLDGCCLEYFCNNQKKWKRADTRLRNCYVDRYRLPIDFDLTDLPSDRFIPAEKAWQLCRSGEIHPSQFGSRFRQGLQYVKNRLIQEIAFRNKKEMLVWDLWGLMLSENQSDYIILDDLSRVLTDDDNDVHSIQNFYQHHSSIQVPSKIISDNPFLGESFVDVV